MTKKNLKLGGVLIVLIMFAYFFNGPFGKVKNYIFGSNNFLNKIDVEYLDIIEIEKDGTKVILKKLGDKWKIAETKDFYVKKIIMEGIIDAISKTKNQKLDLVSNNSERKIDFQTDKAGIKLKISDKNEKKAEFIIGKIASNYKSTYVSLSDSPNTYLVKVNLFTPFNQEEWRDLTIFSSDSDKEKINKIRFQYPTREFTTTKEEGKWKGITPYLFEINEEKINKILDTMTKLDAIQIPEQKFENTGLDKSSIIIQATGDYIDNTIMVGNSNNDGLYYAKRSDSDNIYLISKDARDELNKTISQLK